MAPIYQIVPPRKSAVDHPNHFVRQPAIDRERDLADRCRVLLAALVVCIGVSVAAFALWQAQSTRTVYVPVPTASMAPPPARVVVTDTTTQNRTAAPPRMAAPVAMPVTRVITAAAVPTPADYAARDRQIAELKRRIEDIDETIRRVRADPHWYGMIKNSTATSRQQTSDAYLDQLDKQRNDLRRQKWALEGR